MCRKDSEAAIVIILRRVIGGDTGVFPASVMIMLATYTIGSFDEDENYHTATAECRVSV